VPEAKTTKNRLHLDLASAERAADVARLVGLGAVEVGEREVPGARWTTLRDPDGNEFCVAEEPTAGS
jgi:hypothetical protein